MIDDPFLNYFALGLLVFVVVVIFYGIIAIHDIPAQIAEARHHPHADAIHAYLSRRCPLWVISGYRTVPAPCPLPPQSGHGSAQLPRLLCAKSRHFAVQSPCPLFGQDRVGYFSIDCNTSARRSASLMMLLSQVVSRRSTCPALLRSMATTPRFTELPSFVHSKPPP